MLETHRDKLGNNGKVILAYSGGLDTSVCIRYLQTLHKLDVITVTVDCGQHDDFKEIERKARAIGAIKHVHIDAREEFARDYIVPSIKANGLYQGKYPLATALARPLIAAKAVEVAKKEGATAIAHGCTGKGNDQIRFDVTMRALGPNLKIIAPIRDLNQYVNDKAGAHGVGIVDHIEDRVVGIKSREVYEAPAAVAIIEAHKDLEKMVLTNHELAFKQMVDNQWSWLAYSGLWQDPLRVDLDRFIDSTQNRVSGKVRLKMQKGSLRVVGRESEYSLYRNNLATYAAGSIFDQSLAKGFVELWGLQSVIANSLIADVSIGGKNKKEVENEIKS